MRRLAVLVAVVAALVVPGTSLGGGAAAWLIGGGPGPNVEAGDVWVAKLRAVSCLGSPANDAPTLTLVSRSGERMTVRGQRTAVADTYTARVVFPSAGTWSYRVTIWGMGEPARSFVVAPAASQPSRLLAALPPLGAVLLVLGTGALVRRRRAS